MKLYRMAWVCLFSAALACAGVGLHACSSSGAALQVSESGHDFGADETEWAFEVFSAVETAATPMTFSVSSNQDWLVVQPTSGSSIGPQDVTEVTVSVQRRLITKAVRSGVITVQSGDDIATLDISVDYTAAGLPVEGETTEGAAEGGVEGATEGGVDVNAPVDVPDAALAAALRGALSLPEGAILRVSALQTLTEISFPDGGIADLTGLEHAVNLQRVVLLRNQVSSLAPLAALTKMTDLVVSDNQATDLSPLTGLTRLQRLDVSRNGLLAFPQGMTGMTGLMSLFAAENSLTSIAPLAGMPKLGAIDLSDNDISDLSPLASVPQLALLKVENNQITDLQALIDNPNLGGGDAVYLTGNPLNPATREAQVTALEDRGVTVVVE